jgi:hypothetical protein
MRNYENEMVRQISDTLNLWIGARNLRIEILYKSIRALVKIENDYLRAGKVIVG